MNAWKKCVLCACFFAFFEFLFFSNNIKDQSCRDMIIDLSFGYPQLEIAEIIGMTIKAMYLFVFQVFMGVSIYKHFCTASVYYFSRCSKRKIWFIKETISVFLMALLYITVLVTIYILLSGINHPIAMENGFWKILIVYIVINSLWLFITVVVINLLSIKLQDSSIGFIIVALIQFFLFWALYLWKIGYNIEFSGATPESIIILKLNPIAHLILSWHSSRITQLNINFWNLKFDFIESIILFSIIALIVIVMGCVIIKKQDVISSNRGE